MKKLSKIQIKQLNSAAEIDNNLMINDFLNLTPEMNFDIYKEGCYLIEAKLNIKNETNGLAKAIKELENYANKLKFFGKKLPRKRLILDYETKSLYNIDGDKICNLVDFDFDQKEDFENYDITYENGPNVAQQIYSRHPKINDRNIFYYFKSGIDWYNKSDLRETDFRMVLDLFNDPQTQKKRGAFYTPDIYIYISTEYLRNAIKKVPKGKDYVILDRCAGSGQLEKFLNDEELSHCVLSTIGIAEWISLWNIYGTKVRTIIPPFVKGKIIDQKTKPNELLKQVNFKDNQVKGADALSEEFYKSNKHLWEGKYIIILENPPYAESSNGVGKKAKGTKFSDSYIKEIMKKHKFGNAGNDLDNQFLFSAWNIVNCNAYIHYGPIKSWKTQHLYDKKFIDGFVANREKFHASEGGICITHWENINDKNNYLLLNYEGSKKPIKIKKAFRSIEKTIVSPNSSKNFELAVLKETSFFHKLGTSRIADPTDENKKSMSHDIFGVNKKNILQFCVVFALGQYQCKTYLEKEIITKTADGNIEKWMTDKEFLNDCANWVYFTNKNKCSDDYGFFSELSKQISSFESSLKLSASNILKYAKIEKWIGLAIIDEKYNTTSEDTLGRKQKDNPQLDMSIKELQKDLNDFYDTHITPKMFEYELLK